MSASQWQTKIVPAQLAFLAIYNPSFGPTDETFPDQVLFWYSRKDNEAKNASKKKATKGGKSRDDELREEENEKLRQVGLAQGMVDFARTFSNGEPVDSVETEKSRIVLHELEPGWWILASIDLTQLPAPAPTATTITSTKGTTQANSKPLIEYSSREVSPPELLTQQLLQAHYVFSLHHGSSLGDLWAKQSRDKFCSIIDRYWARFARGWDVLLHGNPAADIFSGLKLASGGELGFGVGEEDWGSGEREVVEDLAHRTEGLVDLVVARYGEPAPALSNDPSTLPESEALPWFGGGNRPIASDGIIFGGIGAISRPSLRNVSLWMRDIYTHGEYAYGVRDNPHRERRKRRRRNPRVAVDDTNGSAHKPVKSSEVDPNDSSKNVQQSEAVKQEGKPDKPNDPSSLPKDKRPQPHDRVASHDHAADQVAPQMASHPGVPPPIASAAEQALNKATKQDNKETEQAKKEAENEDTGYTLGVPDQYMKYLTFGLSTFAKPSKPQRPPATKRASTSSSKTLRPHNSDTSTKTVTRKPDAEDEQPMMSHVDPIPDGDAIKAKIAMQKRLESKGHFVVGLTGDLDALQPDEDADLTDTSTHDNYGGHRTLLRTLHVEIVPSEEEHEDHVAMQRHHSSDEMARSNFRRLRVLVYVHRPFMYCFLFDKGTASLSYLAFYRSLHQNLAPIHKPLLSSTNVTKVAQRIEASHAASDTTSISSRRSNILPAKPAETTDIYDLLYDPARLTVHTSIPNIPDPGTLAAEGILTGTHKAASQWTRVEALNVHSQILNTLTSTKRSPAEYERTSKTSRGWWVVWMKLPPSIPSVSVPDTNNKQPETDASSTTPIVRGEPAGGVPEVGNEAHRHGTKLDKDPAMYRVAFLVRKASDYAAHASSGSSVRGASGMWSSLGLGMGVGRAEDKTGGASAGWGPGALAGGIGIDARKYVEGLLSLNR